MRRNDWDQQLAQFLAEAEARGFSEDDYCVTFVADAVQRMTDHDYMGEYRGLTRAEALAKCKRDKTTLDDILYDLFDDPIHPSSARRGDIVVLTGDTIGICCGQRSVFLSDEGIAYRSTLECQRAFRVT